LPADAGPTTVQPIEANDAVGEIISMGAYTHGGDPYQAAPASSMIEGHGYHGRA
jgi:hypothetical protein